MKTVLLILIMVVAVLPVHSQGDGCEIINQTSWLVVDGKKLTQTDSVLIQINNMSGDDYTMIYIPYSKSDKVSVKEAWIEDISGNIIRKIKGSDIKDRNAVSNAALYTDYFVKYFELKHNIYPYRIRYTYTVSYDKYTTLYAFYPENIPQNEVKVIVESSNDRPIVFKQDHIKEPVIETSDKKIRYMWTFSSPKLKREADAWYEKSPDYPYLVIQSSDFEFKEKGSFKTWGDYGNWYFRLNKGRDVLPESEKQKINQLLSGINNQKEKIRILYDYLQTSTRYINVSIKYGGLQTYPAEYVCAYRYGDCKALSNYMKAILSYAGITAHFVLIYLGETPRTIHNDFPGGHYFNHVIVGVPMEQDTLYLECTTKNHPPGYIHSYIQNRQALLIKEKGSQLVNIPAMRAEDILCSGKTDIRMDGNGLLSFNLTETKRGSDYEFYSGITTEVDKNTLDKYIRNSIFKGVNIELSSYNIKNSVDTKPLILFNCEGKITNHHNVYGKNIIINPIPIYLPAYETPDNREYGIRINYPIYKQDTIVYTMNDKVQLKSQKDSLNIESSYGYYNLSYEVKGKQIWIYKSLLIHAGKYQNAMYPEFYTFINKIKNSEHKKLYFELL